MKKYVVALALSIFVLSGCSSSDSGKEIADKVEETLKESGYQYEMFENPEALKLQLVKALEGDGIIVEDDDLEFIYSFIITEENTTIVLVGLNDDYLIETMLSDKGYSSMKNSCTGSTFFIETNNKKAEFKELMETICKNVE